MRSISLSGIRFVPVARVAGTLVGLDLRWLRARGMVMLALVVLCTPAGPLSPDARIPMWARLCFGLASVLSLALTSLGHELGHALAGRLAGLHVRAVVVGPDGGLTIRAPSDDARVNFCTALAGPLANVALGTACLVLLSSGCLGGLGRSLLPQLVALQLITGVVNLLPIGRMDGTAIVAAWQALALERQPRAARALSPALS